MNIHVPALPTSLYIIVNAAAAAHPLGLSGVGVNAAQHARFGCHPDLVLASVSRQRCVVALNVEFEFVFQTVAAEELEGGGGVEGVEVIQGAVGFGLQKQGTFEPYLLLVVSHQAEEPGG